MKSLPRFLLAGSCLALLAAPAFADSVAEILTTAQAAYQRGDLVTAKQNFELVYQLDSHNQTAITFLRRLKAQMPKADGGAKQETQFAGVIIPQIRFTDATLGSALEFIKQQTAKATDGKIPINFVLQIPAETATNTTITLSLTNTPLTEVLRYVGGLAGVTFSYEKYAVVVKPKTAPATAPAPAQ